MSMEVILLVLFICVILALKPVKDDSYDRDRLSPPAVERKLEEGSVESGLTYQFQQLNTPMEDMLEINSQDIAAQKQSITRVKIETFQFEGRTYLAIEQHGILIVREDS